MFIIALSSFLPQVPIQLPDTVVVETRQITSISDSSPSVSRIDVTQATDTGLTTLTGVLGSVPGIYSIEQSGEGTLGSLFLRGTNSSHTAVMLDGRRLPQGFSNTYEINRYRIYGLSTVEILRGPTSTLYGANALGGVVDLRQHSPISKPEHIIVHTEGGSYGRGSFNFSSITNDTSIKNPATQGTAISLSSTHDDGWRPNSDRSAVSSFLKHEILLGPLLTFDIIGSADYNKLGLPGQSINGSIKFVDWQRDTGWLLSPGLRYQDDKTEANLFWSQAGSTVESLTVPFQYRYLLNRDELTALIDHKLSLNLKLGLGLSYEKSSYDQRDIINNTQIWADTHESIGIWSRAEWCLTSKSRLRASVRRDQFTDFAPKTTGELSYAHRLDKELLVHAKIGTAYRVPSANDLAYGTHLGIPLRPEINTGTELGLRYESIVLGDLSWTIVFFRNELTDLIDYNPSSYQTYNIAQAQTQGVEFGIDSKPAKGLRTFSAATWLDTEIQSSNYYLSTGSAGDKLLRRPVFSLTIGLELYPNDDWLIGISGTHTRGREDFNWNAYSRVDLPDATFARMWIRYRISEGMEFAFRLENILGENAPPSAFGFPAQPRSAYFSLTTRF